MRLHPLLALAAPLLAVEPLPGVFVSLSGGDPDDVTAVAALFAASSPHRPPSSPVYVGALVFRETAACEGGFDGAAATCTLYEVALEAYEPFFGAADRVWLGLAGEPSTGDPLKRADSGLCESWLDENWVGALSARYGAAATLLADRYAGTRFASSSTANSSPNASIFGLYLTHELFVEHLVTGCRAQNGTWIASSAYAAAVAEGMGRVVAAARAAAPAWPVMWSPAATESAPMPNRTDMIAAASVLFNATGLDELHLQDSVGKGSSLAPDGTVQSRLRRRSPPEYPRRGRGAAAAFLRGISTSRPRPRRDESPRNIHVAAAASPRRVVPPTYADGRRSRHASRGTLKGPVAAGI